MSIDTKALPIWGWIAHHRESGGRPIIADPGRAAMLSSTEGWDVFPVCRVDDARRNIAALEAENQRLRAELARVRELPAKWRAAPQNPDEPLLAIAADELDAALSQPAEQHDPLAVSDHCPECSEPEPECACDERESLPLMARRLRHKDDDLGELYESGKRLCTISGEPPLREPMPGFVLYRIADTDEHGLPVIERTADMPKRAKYRLTWIMQADAAGGEVEYTDSLPLALEANRSGAVSERIEDYRP